MTEPAHSALAGAGRQPSGLTMFLRPDGDRSAFVVCGELDVNADQEAWLALHAAISRSDQGIELDLDGVELCDCSAVNIALSVSSEALHRHEADEPSLRGGEGHAAEHREVMQLRRAMHSHATIDIARGVLMAAFTLSADDAWDVLVTTSQNTNAKLHTVAQHIADSITGPELPEDVRDELASAVGAVAR